MGAKIITARDKVKYHKLAGDSTTRSATHDNMVRRPLEIAYRLLKSREALGKTQTELARELHIAQNRWSQYETGRRIITVDIAILLADIYGIGLDWVYRGDPNDLPAELRSKVMRSIRDDQGKTA